MDTGEFVSELRANLNEDADENEYITFDMPLTGVNVNLRMDETGAPIVVIGAGAVEYTFDQVE